MCERARVRLGALGSCVRAKVYMPVCLCVCVFLVCLYVSNRVCVGEELITTCGSRSSYRRSMFILPFYSRPEGNKAHLTGFFFPGRRGQD